MGMSGCSLRILDKNVIRKQSPTIEYNSRLVKQIEKQSFFHQFKIDSVAVPTVYSHGYENDLFYADMEYINGKLFIEEFEKIGNDTVVQYTNTIIGYLNYCLHSTQQTYTSYELKDIIKNKLQSLLPTSEHKNFIQHLISYTEVCMIDNVPKTLCHGDLTFSNMLFYNNNIYFLDFLDSYIDSVVIDIVKLKQDLYYHWCIKNVSAEKHTLIRIQQIFRYIWHRLDGVYSSIVHSDFFDLVDVINFLRIEPYVRTQHQRHVLNESIQLTELYKNYRIS